MILKQKDSLDERLAHLELALRIEPAGRRKSIEREIATLKAGDRGERDTAYYIDFELKDSKKWAVIHDLRIEWNGRVAQIDHILINRLLEMYVIESKSFRSKIRCANGGWERLNLNHWEGIASPVEQNERHITVLREAIRDQALAPSRFGLEPKYLNIVAVQPSCSIIGDFPKGTNLFRTDQLVKKVRDLDISLLAILKVISEETLREFAETLVGLHRPASFTPKIPAGDKTSPPAPSASASCQNCGGKLSAAEAAYCKKRSNQFAGLLLCHPCQGYAPKIPSNRSAPRVNPAPDTSGPHCAECHASVDGKVVAYCRLKSKMFTGRILCRKCQAAAQSAACQGTL